ncbi:aminotransferase [Kitasatospora herbaricolor]|nr:aminotransferase [Kitasatospora herbaricolor]
MTAPYEHTHPRVLVVQHEAECPPGLWGGWLAECRLKLDVLHPYAGDELPAGVGHFDGLLVLGGSPGPWEDDKYPWLPATRVLLRRGVEDDVPTFGICLGAELLIAAFGGRVERRATPQVGIHALEVLPAAAGDPVFADTPDDPPAVLWHQEEMTALPEHAVPLLTGTEAPNQAFRLGRHAWGTQFHPEADRHIISEWSRDSALLKRSGKQPHEIVSQLDDTQADAARAWRPAAHRWAELVRQRYDQRNTVTAP